ncbi:MAG: type II toxin-antitoxin system HicA family toxin [Candidatus Scalindua sp.]|nr:type II toxin-antitoxin system HicA family toxin [Candidatus Scalindua sp.]
MTSKRFPAVTSNEVVKVLESIGFQFVCQFGNSHAIYKRAGDRRRTNVPIHSGKIIKRKTLKAILHDAGLTVDQFRDLKGE